MNISQKQARVAGIALLSLGVIALFNLWGLIPAVLLAGGGVAIYRRQRTIGKVNEAIQALLWGVGLAVLVLLDGLFPGVLLLGGASLLLRGHEGVAEQRVAGLIGRVASRRATPGRMTSPIATNEQPTTNETVRL